MPPDDQAAYAELLAGIERVRALIEQLEAEDPSGKRDAAIQLLREHQAAAIMRLREIESDSHRN